MYNLLGTQYFALQSNLSFGLNLQRNKTRICRHKCEEAKRLFDALQFRSFAEKCLLLEV